MRPWVQKFNPCDLYSKRPQPPDGAQLRPSYAELIAGRLPDKLAL